MLNKVLLVIALAVLIAVAAYGVAWVFTRGMQRFLRALPWQATWHRLRNPWEEEDAAWERLHHQVQNLDPELLPGPKKPSGPGSQRGS